MAKYGMPYKGSKSQIADWVISNLPSGDVFVDLMSGGCAVTHAAMESGKYGRFIANDISGTTELFKECINGDLEGYCTIPDREQFFEEKTDDLAMSLIMSFGNDKETYLWSKTLEPVKIEASKMLSAPSMHERRIHYRRFIKMLGEYGLKEAKGHNGDLKSLEILEILESLERLERLQSLESLERLERLETTCLDYSRVEIPNNSIVYADPPYFGTRGGAYTDFDHERFYRWLESVDFPVFVSEYTCPDGCVEIASKDKRILSDTTNKQVAVEKLFIQERFAEAVSK